MRFVLKALAGLVVAFVAMGAVTSAGRALTGGMFGTWPTGTQPPIGYMVTAVAIALVASAVAGILAALVVGRARHRHALAYGAIFTAMQIMADRATLFADPHPYQWPLVLAPIVGIPLGAWLVVTLKPLPQADPAIPALS